ncbi:MAG: DUF58 domain-containing protein, partial [Acidimicrobiia bacterium]|nr:DUF58 domain-containing protein [Acidimicrobiia bacterium]
GDDVRHVDWNVTARMDQLYVREYTEDRELTAWLLLDRSPSMGFGPVDRTKEHLLRDFTTTIARLLVRDGNRVGAIVYDNQVCATVPPRQGRNQVLLLLRALLGPVAPTGRPTDLSRLLDTAARVIRRRSLVVVVSDFISEPGWERGLARLGERHEVVAVRLWDPREFELPVAGLIAVQDAETGEQLLVDSSDPEFRRRLRRAGEERAMAARDAARRAGVDLHVISTDDDLVEAFVRIVESRRRRKG